MERPFAVIGFTLFGAMFLLSLTDSNPAAYCVFFTSISIGVLTLTKKDLRQALTLPVCFFTVASACLLFVSFNSHKLTAQKLTGELVKVEASVAEAPYMKNENGRHYCVLKLERVDGKKVTGRLRLSFSPEKDSIDENLLDIGNRISFTGKVYIPGESEKSISRYFTGENIFLGAYAAKNVSITKQARRSIGYYIELIRDFVSDSLRYAFGDRIAGLLTAMLTGSKDFLDPHIYDAFRRTGTAHLMAVSGLHLSIWVFFIGSLFTSKRKTEKLRTILLMLCVAFIMLLAGMSESVKRAGFMSLVFLCGNLFHRDNDSLNSLGLAVTVILLLNPGSALSISLQLSFLSTLGILTLGKYCIERSEAIFGGKRINTPLKKLLRSASDMFIISISVLVFTLPVLVYSFGGFSAVTVWVNMLTAPVVTPLLVLSGLIVIFSGLPFISYPIMLVVKFIAEYIILLTEFFAKTKNSFIIFEAENTLLIIAAALIIFSVGVILIPKNFRKRTAVVLCSVTVASALIICNKALAQEKLQLHMTAYEDAFSAAVERDNKAMLIHSTDEYEKSLFVSELEEKGIDVFCEAVDGEHLMFRKLRDGKYITDEKSFTFFDGFAFEQREGEKILEFDGKYIHIFYGGALQYENCCDIIIQILTDDIAVITSDKRLSLKQEKAIEIDL